MITSVEELAAPLQSGRAYLRANMVSMIKNKVKTRPDTAVETPPPQGVPLQRTITGGTLKKTSGLGRFRRHNQERGEEPQKWFSRLAKLGKQTAEGMRVLVKGTPNARELPWKNFTKIRGAGILHDRTGWHLVVKFTPPFENDPTITFHRPHDRVLHLKQLQKIREGAQGTRTAGSRRNYLLRSDEHSYTDLFISF
ncbi:hypothetical protein K438DRAFT_2030552 [Mycena galopus ATCC 62051]|nr:hypothetical protein K438DRAFT_2030552 [Mycena galopus ATCC 62051]